MTTPALRIQGNSLSGLLSFGELLGEGVESPGGATPNACEVRESERSVACRMAWIRSSEHGKFF